MKLFVLSAIIFISLSFVFIHKDIVHNAGFRCYFDEPKVYYRLARSETKGVFSEMGLLGYCDSRLHLRGQARQKKSFSTYLSGACPVYTVYMSQSGGQGIIFSLISKIHKDPIILRLFCAFFLSGVLTAWFIWLCGYYGLSASFLIMTSVLTMQSLRFSADNIAQVLGATYLIMVVMFWAYERKIKNTGFVAFSVVLFKLLFTGPEYVFSALLLPYLPLFFYGILNDMPMQKFKKEILSITKGVALACFTALLILMIQVSVVNSVSHAWQHFDDRVKSRTFFPKTLSLGERKAINRFSGFKLLCKYLSFDCFRFGSFKVSFGMMIFFLNIISLLALYLYSVYHQKELLALLVTTWVSILCPLSWILIAEGHSATHLHDELVWHMPFTLFGMALVVVTLKNLIMASLNELNKN